MVLLQICANLRSRSVFEPTTLKRAIKRLGFVQTDPIWAPARALDLTLRPRVVHYRAADLERLYARLGIEGDLFVNYGFMPPELRALTHPRPGLKVMSKARARRAHRHQRSQTSNDSFFRLAHRRPTRSQPLLAGEPQRLSAWRMRQRASSSSNHGYFDSTQALKLSLCGLPGLK